LLPIGIATIKLVISDEETAIAQARQLIDRVKQNVGGGIPQQQLLQLVETIIVYKFPTVSREEIQAMFSLSELKQTRFYRKPSQKAWKKARNKAKAKLL